MYPTFELQWLLFVDISEWESCSFGCRHRVVVIGVRPKRRDDGRVAAWPMIGDRYVDLAAKEVIS